MEHAILAPFATRQLTDPGPRVIKIDRPCTRDFARGYDERVRGLSPHFVWTNRSKECLTLDKTNADADAILKRLIIEKADIVVQSLAPRLLRCDRRAVGIADRSYGPRMDAVPALSQHTDAILAEMGLDSAVVATSHLAKAVL
jgi:crotonobetainyl-CoA:carnitine CoA-transferase CaiB-like acyl-CoA transferase